MTNSKLIPYAQFIRDSSQQGVQPLRSAHLGMCQGDIYLDLPKILSYFIVLFSLASRPSLPPKFSKNDQFF